MRRFVFTMLGCLMSHLMYGQIMNINQGLVKVRAAAAEAGNMNYVDGTKLTVMGKTYLLNEIDSIWFDNASLTTNEVTVHYDGDLAYVTLSANIAPYLDITIDGAHVSIVQSEDVTSEITYVLEGKTDNGSFLMDGQLKATLKLNGLTLTNPQGAAINIRDGKRIKVIIADETLNELEDGADGDQKGCFMVKGHTEFDGTGELSIKGNTAHAFWGKEYVEMKKDAGVINILGAVSDGFNVNQYFQQNGGTINVENVGDDGIQVSFKTDDDDNIIEDDSNTGAFLMKGGILIVSVTAAGAKGIKAEGPISINEDKNTTDINITATGGVVVDGSDYTGSVSMKSEKDILLSAGTINLTHLGVGGRALLCDGNLNIEGSTFYASAEGSNYGSGRRRSAAYPGTGFGPGGQQGPGGGGQQGPGGGGNSSSSGKNAKGVKAKGSITIADGNVNVSSANHEGLESKSTITISGGSVYVKASDDAINSSSDLTISGGNVYAYSTSNDGMDANGNMYVSGGVAIGFGAGGAETGIDIDEQHRLYITGGELFGIGGRTDSSMGGGMQAYGTVSGASCSAGGYFVLSSGSTHIFAVKVPAAYSGVVLVSSPSLSSGSSYTIGASTNTKTFTAKK